MARVQTWQEFRDDLKTEIGLQTLDAREDALLLALANEGLVQAVSAFDDLRDFRIDEQIAITAIDKLVVTTLIIAEIDQAYYLKILAGNVDLRYDLTEQSGLIGPAPIQGYTNAYTISSTVNAGDPNLIDTTVIFYPINSGKIGDKIQIIGSGFKYITDNTTKMPYFSIYTWLKLFIAERYANKRNLDPTKIQMLGKMFERSAPLAAGSTKDSANTENTRSK